MSDASSVASDNTLRADELNKSGESEPTTPTTTPRKPKPKVNVDIAAAGLINSASVGSAPSCSHVACEGNLTCSVVTSHTVMDDCVTALSTIETPASPAYINNTTTVQDANTKLTTPGNANKVDILERVAAVSNSNNLPISGINGETSGGAGGLANGASDHCMSVAAPSNCPICVGHVSCQCLSSSANVNNDLSHNIINSKQSDQVVAATSDSNSSYPNHIQLTDHSMVQSISGSVHADTGEFLSSDQSAADSHKTYASTISSTDLHHTSADLKPTFIQRCTSWSPSVDNSPRQPHFHEEHRRRTTDSVPSNLMDQLNNESDPHSNAFLSNELAHIFGRKTSIPCGHSVAAGHPIPLDCEHCSDRAAAVAAATAASTSADHVPTCESPVSNHSYSPSLNSSGAADSMATLNPSSDFTTHNHTHSVVNPQAHHIVVHHGTHHMLPHTPQKTAGHGGADDAVSSVVKIARMVKRASNGGPTIPVKAITEIIGQVPNIEATNNVTNSTVHNPSDQLHHLPFVNIIVLHISYYLSNQ